MHADIHHELRTICSRARREGRGRWSVVRGDKILATIEGGRGSYVATVPIDGTNRVSPAYPFHQDAVEAACAPLVADVRGGAWEFPPLKEQADDDD